MKRYLLLLSVCCCCCTALAQAPWQAANRFITALDASQRAKASFSFDDAERYNWFFVPIDRKGLPLKELTAAQHQAALDLLRASLSEEGSQKALAIIQLEILLKELENRGPDDHYRDPGKYYFSFFGTPAAAGAWAWRIEGHHLSLHFSSVNGKVVSGTPTFFGSNPARIPKGADEGKMILQAEAELGFQLLESLTPEQQKKAIVSDRAPHDILTGNSRKALLQKEEGILFAELTKAQQQLYLRLLGQYVRNYPLGFSREFMEKIEKAGLDHLRFAWAGGRKWGEGHYYRLQNAAVLVEYDCTQNNANHIHTVVRDLSNDFGEDVLQKHYRQEHPGH
ncbi:DUF3500 domain-containing protein [Siphonobacter aquaeclarae]|uniref:DUF3500 domain-containing protein n=1 Tax=Siphonobacter aquaeclarae TaxID=563176 RepID=A0A1G9KRW1_9BACT|nr:DUF3500 domain-containing protein [Siphonobacter aquaeclarae]SDL52451.1 Protein of unknown function [Siphonobacter aquaeclarae]